MNPRNFMIKKRNITKKGYILILVLVFGAIGVYVVGGLIGWGVTDIIASRQTVEREQALQIAEAGIDYYRWHLAHAPTDFQDGTATSGPYIHEYFDKDGNLIGHYRLTITPPLLGSTLVTVLSTGSTTLSNTERSVAVQFAKPSIAKYAVVANDTMRFGAGTEIFGQIHSNQGIRFDGLTHNLITSAVATYDDPDHTGGDEFGVHTHDAPTDPLPPAAVPNRTDVFEVGREFPVPAVDFSGITADLAQMRTDAQANGYYRANSGSLGYRVVLRTDDTFDLYRVTAYTNAPANCTNVIPQAGWGTWSIQNQNLLGNFAFPTNGILFFEDHVFVEGQVNGARIIIVAATLPDVAATRRNIIVNNDVLYTAYDGTDVVGLIGQNNVLVGLVSDTDLRIDAALIAQNGFTGRYYYRPPGGGQARCSPNHSKTTVTLWGMIATNQRYGFGYTDGTGYATRNINYDGSLLYNPPPSFPLASDEYVTLTWEEI